jgi:hypothetical protein
LHELTPAGENTFTEERRTVNSLSTLKVERLRGQVVVLGARFDMHMGEAL